MVEVSLRCDYSDNLMKQVVGTSMAEVILTLEVLRAKNLRPFNPGLLSKAKHSKKKGKLYVILSLKKKKKKKCESQYRFLCESVLLSVINMQHVLREVLDFEMAGRGCARYRY